jgi:hypothetical protein
MFFRYRERPVSYSQAGVLAPCEAVRGNREEIGVDDAAMLRSVEPHFSAAASYPTDITA